MPILHLEALVYSLLWAALAVAGWAVAGWPAGVLLTVGLFLVIMPSSALILSRTGSFSVERAVRWSILGIAGIALAIYADVSG